MGYILVSALNDNLQGFTPVIDESTGKITGYKRAFTLLIYGYILDFFVSTLNDNLQGFTPIINESTGEITGYKTTIGGADTVFPFSKLKTVVNVTSDVKPTEKITVTYDNELIAFIAINNTYNERHMFQLLSKTPVYVSTGHYTCETDKHSITINNISYYTEGTFTIYALIK